MGKWLLIGDDEPGFRDLTKRLLERAPEFDVVGEAHRGSSALAGARELEPDVVLLDVNLPDTTRFELAPLLAAVIDYRRALVGSVTDGTAGSEATVIDRLLVDLAADGR